MYAVVQRRGRRHTFHYSDPGGRTLCGTRDGLSDHGEVRRPVPDWFVDCPRCQARHRKDAA